jgi:hypothetical protein
MLKRREKGNRGEEVEGNKEKLRVFRYFSIKMFFADLSE